MFYRGNYPRNSVIFTNNNASQGTMIYGGLLDRCFVYYGNTGRTLGIEHLNSYSEYDSTPGAITSDPGRICLCTENRTLDCTTRSLTFNKMRGQAIELSGIVVDQDNHPKASYIRAVYSELLIKIGKGDVIKETGVFCSQLSYHIFAGDSAITTTLVLQPDSYCACSDYTGIKIDVTLKPCSRGFELDTDEEKCVCDKRLTEVSSSIVCDIDTNSILAGSMWLSYNDKEYVRVHANCPLNYCRGSASDSISIEYPDEQCASNHRGILCGVCQDNHSIALGGSKCLQCTSNYTLIWLLPVFAAAGIALVALLMVCNMTVSHGTLNGLIFYANVVSIAGLTCLRNCSVHPILSIFVAWVNLDFGIETCFYSGMDTYQKTWLQFAFPLYIIMAAGWSHHNCKPLFGHCDEDVRPKQRSGASNPFSFILCQDPQDHHHYT